MSSSKIPVIYILGSGHSGSTLLDLIIGSHSEIESAGEISNFIYYFDPLSKRKDKACTCGLPVDKCHYWGEVGNIIDLKALGDINVSDHCSFEKKNYELIRAILKVSGKSLFCESSKSISRLENYLNSQRFSVTIVHLVRDPRAVAYSHVSKRKRLIESQGGQGYKKWLKENNKKDEQYLFFPTLKGWRFINEESIKRFSQKPEYLLVRYEDLAAYPRREVRRILNAIDLDVEDAQFEFSANEHHNIGGNRMRMSGSHEIKKDIRYINELSPTEWWMGTIYMFRMLQRFGYPVNRKNLI